MNKFSGVLQTLSEAPDDQIDKSITLRLKKMVVKKDFYPFDLLQILDECAFGSLASDFAMQAMHFVWEDMCKAKGLDSVKILQERKASLV